MLDRAQVGEWSTLTELEQQRRKALKKFFSQPQAMAEAQQLRQDIRQLQEIDERVMSLVGAEQERSKTRLAQFSNGRRAHAAYTQGLRQA